MKALLSLGFCILLSASASNCQRRADQVTATLGVQAPPQPFPIEGYRGKVFLGLGTKSVKLPEDKRFKSTYGLEVIRVAAESSADRSDLRVGDVIVSMDGSEWQSDQIRLSHSFGKAGAKYRPGESVHFLVLRKGTKPESQLSEHHLILQPYPGTVAESPRSATNEQLRPDLKATRRNYEQLCWDLIRETGYEADCRDLLMRLLRCEEYPDPHRLQLCRYVHRDPFKLETVSREMVKPFLKRTSHGTIALFPLLDHVGRMLDGFPNLGSDEGIKQPTNSALLGFQGGDLEAHLDYVEAVLTAAADWHKKAFAKLNEDEVRFIQQNRNGMLDSYITYRMLSYDGDTTRQKASVRIIKLAARLDRKALFEQAKTVSLIVSQQFTSSLLKAASISDINVGVVAQRNSKFGPILIAGKTRTRYQGRHYAAIYELGGDDVYANNQAGSVWPSIPSSVIVDFEGDDAYESYAPFSQGCGDFGVGFLVDLKGNDNYIGTRFTQGTGFFGVGALVDETGNDLYRGIEFHQGVGHWGAGLLIDLSGTDRYETNDTSQGVGLPGGCGVLVDGGAEGDSYYCKGKEPTGYGTAGVFEGWGQGQGIGYRPYASGGIGILIDRDGKDRFEAGNFSQGGGYFYAFGLLYNAGKAADTYVGSRYAQGFGCHQAAGAFIEEGGDDSYKTRHAVAQGLAWDESVALFVEEGGNDRYEGGGFSQGASAMNGWTLFFDRAGKDTYLYTDQARAGGNSYHGGTSLSFFVDAGGQEDRYPSKKNNTITNGGERFIFVDLPGSLDDSLKNSKWKALLKKPLAK